jgi:glycine/D-amino acid oxidase-like deaminating enzyme
MQWLGINFSTLLEVVSPIFICVCRWEVVGVRSGVRALPQRSAQGSLPLAGKLEAGGKWWIVAGLGARGLVYHAWLGRLLARAVLGDDESALPRELRRWQP